MIGIVRWYARVAASRDLFSFCSRRNQFVYQICLLNRSSLDPCRTLPLPAKIDRLDGRYPSFCGLGEVCRVVNLRRHAGESPVIGRMW
jgi:hypothetical protein